MANDRLRKSRKSHGLTQKELAEIIKVSEMTVHRWEKGERNPDSESLRALARALNTTTSYLLGETDDPEPNGAKPQASLVNAAGANVQAPIAGRDNNLAITPQTGALDLAEITPFVLQLKEQGNTDKIQDALGLFEWAVSTLKRAVQGKSQH